MGDLAKNLPRLMPAVLALLALSCHTTTEPPLREYLNTLEQENASLRIENMRLRADIEELQARQQPDPLAMVPLKYQEAKPVVFFASSSSIVRAKYLPEVREVAAILRQHPGLYITLEGYADHRGAPDDNNKLAQERALAVADLIEATGVDSYRINIQVVGAPVVGQDLSAKSLQANRKVIAFIHSSAH